MQLRRIHTLIRRFPPTQKCSQRREPTLVLCARCEAFKVRHELFELVPFPRKTTTGALSLRCTRRSRPVPRKCRKNESTVHQFANAFCASATLLFEFVADFPCTGSTGRLPMAGCSWAPRFCGIKLLRCLRHGFNESSNEKRARGCLCLTQASRASVQSCFGSGTRK